MVDGNGFLGKDAIFGADDARFAVVQVPEWGGVVRIRALSGAEADAFAASKMGTKNIRARLVAMSVVDAAGKRILTEADADQLGRKSVVPLTTVFKAACTLNGLDEEGTKDIEKNSETAPTDVLHLS